MIEMNEQGDEILIGQKLGRSGVGRAHVMTTETGKPGRRAACSRPVDNLTIMDAAALTELAKLGYLCYECWQCCIDEGLL